MYEVNLSQFSSLFEIGFALHLAVAFIERIYAKELPTRIERITARAKSLERFKEEILDHENHSKTSGTHSELKLGFKTITSPVWVAHNEQVIDRLYALRQDTNGQMHNLKTIVNLITILSVLVLLYSVTMLFLIGLDYEIVKGLDRLTASALVLLQILPLPIAATIFYFVSKKFGHETDRKIRGIGELNLILTKDNASTGKNFVSIDQVYRRFIRRNGYTD